MKTEIQVGEPTIWHFETDKHTVCFWSSPGRFSFRGEWGSDHGFPQAVVDEVERLWAIMQSPAETTPEIKTAPEIYWKALSRAPGHEGYFVDGELRGMVDRELSGTWFVSGIRADAHRFFMSLGKFLTVEQARATVEKAVADGSALTTPTPRDAETTAAAAQKAAAYEQTVTINVPQDAPGVWTQGPIPPHGTDGHLYRVDGRLRGSIVLDGPQCFIPRSERQESGCAYTNLGMCETLEEAKAQVETAPIPCDRKWSVPVVDWEKRAQAVEIERDAWKTQYESALGEATQWRTLHEKAKRDAFDLAVKFDGAERARVALLEKIRDVLGDS